MQFDYDIFISYAKKDNKPLPDSDKGWVSHFQNYLEIRLTQLLGKKPKVLHYSNQEKPAAAELLKACVFISILSPEYILDKESIEDIDIFFANAEKSNNLKIGNRERIFKVEKSPIPLESQLSKIRPLLGYDMFEIDPLSGDTKELNTFFGKEAEQHFWMRLDDLAHDIYDMIRHVRVSREEVKVKQNDSIYLAVTGHDLTIERDLIRRELQRHGYRVLPEHELPSNVREMEAEVKKDLKECKLSIHLIGDSYGEVPQGTNKSVIDIQNQLAAEHSNYVSSIPGENSDFSRLIWVSPNAKLGDEKQKLFIENIKRDAESMSGAEVVQTPLEDLKNIIRTELLNEIPGRPERKEETRALSMRSFYLIYDTADEAGASEVASFIRDKGNEVMVPKFKGELLEVRNHHFDNLKNCDVALIYFGKASQQWVQMKVLDVLKAPGLGRVKQLLSKAIYVEKGPKLDKDKFNNYDIAIIENSHGMYVSLEPLLAKINK